jgi:hypothetical protein
MKRKFFYLSFFLAGCSNDKATKEPAFETKWEMTDIVDVHPTFEEQFTDSLTEIYFEYYTRIRNISLNAQMIDSNTFIELVDNKYFNLTPVNIINSNHTPLPPFKIGIKKEIVLVLKSRQNMSWHHDVDKIGNELFDPSVGKIKRTRLFYISDEDTIEIKKSKDYFNF